MKSALKIFLVVAVTSVTALGLGQSNQPRVYRVVIIVAGGPAFYPPQLKGLRDGLEEAGYVEGKNLVLDIIAEETYPAVRDLARAQVQGSVDVIVTTGGLETSVASQITRTLPIVFIPASDPVAAGFVKSLATPGTNLTGLTFYTSLENTGKQLEVFKEVVPSLRRIVVLFDGRKENPYRDASLSAVRKVASYLAIKVVEKPVRSAAEVEEVVRPLSKKDADGIFVICGPLFRELKKIASFATQKRLALFGCAASQVADEGVLLTYAPDLYYMGYRGAWYVERIFKGAKPGGLPVETPTKFELVINLKTAHEIGVSIPSEVLVLADRVFD